MLGFIGARQVAYSHKSGMSSQDAQEFEPDRSTDSLTNLHALLPQATISEHLKHDILAADFLVSLFWSAMDSFRHDSILRPFPTTYLEDAGSEGEGVKDIEGLVSYF